MTVPYLPLPAAENEAINTPLPSFTSSGTTALIEIGVHGRWSYELGADVSAGIRQQLAERPSAMIIDLCELLDADGTSLALWLATRRACTAIRPPIALALCLPGKTMLERRLRRIDTNRLPRFTTMCEARAAMIKRRKSADLTVLR
ncbi:hypothetical protein [Winogradskya humida]|nr:hypothetical protein [Actinoplanes humidus]